MPAVTRLRIDALAQLADELRFSPRTTLLKQVERTERLARDLDVNQTYPEDWVIYRITKHRVHKKNPMLIVGDALLAELSAFVERLTDDAAIDASSAPAGALLLGDLCARWRVHDRTIARWRRLGLIARRERFGDGKSRLIFSGDVVDWFERAHAVRLARAAARSRVSPDEARALASVAARLRREHHDVSRNAAARAIAARSSRSDTTIRRQLERVQRGPDQPLFPERGPITKMERRRIARALRRGVSPADVAADLGRSTQAVLRADRLDRASRLRTALVRDAAEALPALQVDAAPLARATDLAAVAIEPEPTLAAHLALARAAPAPPGQALEFALASAHIACVAHARTMLDSASRLHPRDSTIDDIETVLRIAWRLRLRLVHTQRRIILAAIEERLGGELLATRPEVAVRLHLIAMRCASAAAARFDPSRRGRLAAAVGLTLGRSLARATRNVQAAPGRARRTGVELTRLTDWTIRAAAWAPLVAPPPGIAAALITLEPAQAQLLAARFGLLGQAPLSRAHLAAALGKPTSAISRLERTALRHALRPGAPMQPSGPNAR